MKSYSVTIQMKATEQRLPVVLFIMLYKVVVTLESVDEFLKCVHSFESHRALLFVNIIIICPGRPSKNVTYFFVTFYLPRQCYI